MYNVPERFGFKYNVQITLLEIQNCFKKGSRKYCSSSRIVSKLLYVGEETGRQQRDLLGFYLLLIFLDSLVWNIEFDELDFFS